MCRRHTTLLFALATLGFTFASRPADAHVSIAGGTGIANQTQEVVFGVGHGCSGVDTLSIRISIPAGVASVRAVSGTLGTPVVEKDPAGVVTAITWQKPTVDLIEGDLNYYKVSVRMKLPDAPFSTLYFPVRQICSTKQGQLTTVDWAATPAMPDAGTGKPAASLLVLPGRAPGWNRYVLASPISDLKAAFSDAQIVWKVNAAFSVNTTAAELIGATPDVTTLTALAVGDMIWVKY